MSTHLSPHDLQQLQASLQARRDSLDSQRAAHLDGNSRPEHARELLLQDGDDATQRDAEREVDFARTDRDAVALAEIDQALHRLAAGRYGDCHDCGEAIPLARLKLAPQAIRCVACEALLERSQPRPATL
ncbi:MAG: transcriptional regulator, TraR/DksA family protein [Burkholderiales bacterium PBB5]|nr:MAG: transcriptional regulator, TraR/DksA family protein [Burkholderiales bacterium PBB5]